MLPLTRLGERLGFHRADVPETADDEREGESSPHIPVVVVEVGAKKAGLVVDGLAGLQEAVIKPLTGMLKDVKGASGATVLGTGKVALILDVPSVV